MQYKVLKQIGYQGGLLAPGTLIELDETTYGDTLAGHVAEGYLLSVDETSSNLAGPLKPPSSSSNQAHSAAATITIEVPANEDIKIQPIGS